MGNIRENGLVKYFYAKKIISRKAQKKIVYSFHNSLQTRNSSYATKYVIKYKIVTQYTFGSTGI